MEWKRNQAAAGAVVVRCGVLRYLPSAETPAYLYPAFKLRPARPCHPSKAQMAALHHAVSTCAEVVRPAPRHEGQVAQQQQTNKQETEE